MANFPDILAGEGTSKKVEFSVIRAQFGDGYSQRIISGLNNARDTWTVVFDNLTIADATTIEDFIRDTNAVDTFDWTPPGEVSPKKFTCDPQSLSVAPAIGGVVETLNATFVQEFDL